MTCIIACYQIFVGARSAPVSVMVAVAVHHVRYMPTYVYCAFNRAAADVGAGAVSLLGDLACTRLEALVAEASTIPLALRCGGSCSSNAAATPR